MTSTPSSEIVLQQGGECGPHGVQRWLLLLLTGFSRDLQLMAVDERASGSFMRWAALEPRAFVLSVSIVTFLVVVVLAYLMFGYALGASNVREPWYSRDTDYLAAFVGASAIAIVLLYTPLPSLHRAALLLLWAVKTAISLGVMLIYEAQYDFLDAYSYHELAIGSSVKFADLTWGGGTESLIWLLQIAHVFVPPSYHLAKVLFSLVGLVGIYLTWRGVVLLTGVERLRHLFLLGLFPSLLFWSSILGKDPILILLVGVFVFGVAKLQQNRFFAGVLVAFTSAALTSLLRLWMGAILTVPALAVLLTSRTGIRKRFVLIPAVIGIAITAMLATAAIERFGGDAVGLLQSIDDLSRSFDEGGSAQRAPELGSPTDVLAFAPLGAFTALFRPLPGEVGGPFGLAAGIENAVLLVAFAFTMMRVRRKHLLNPSFLMLAGVLFTWAVLYGFVSYQNLGTASRFKAQILPVMLSLMIFLTHRARRVSHDEVAASS